MNYRPLPEPPVNAARGAGGLARVQRALLPFALLLGLLKLGSVVGAAGLPIQNWLFPRYVGYFALSGLWALSCFCAGHAVLRRVQRAPLPVLEHVSLSFAVGVLAFFMLMFAGGLVHAYGPVFFVVLPLAMLAACGGPALRYARRLRRHLRHARSRGVRPRPISDRLLWALGMIALLLFYIPCVVPSHAGYDSRWYHLAIGEHYASLGGIARFEEGWYAGAISHLPSVIYAWAFMLPKSLLFDRMQLAAHLEFASFLMMLPGIPALVRRLVPGARAHAGWVAFFAFPMVYWYDLLSGGDQFAALWCAPIVLALLRFYPQLAPRYGVLLALVVAGLGLTKYSASALVAVTALVVAARMLWLPLVGLIGGLGPGAALRRSFGGVVAGAWVVLLTAPQWLKNWIWYGDPVHPVLHEYFASRPFTQDAGAYYLDYMKEISDYQPTRDWAGIKEALWAVIEHGFTPAHFSLSPPEPYRGALFTLMCACLPFVRGSKRLWAVALMANAAFLGNFWQSRQDRYMLALLPMMAAVIVAVLVLVFRSSLAARFMACALIVLHTVWGLGIFTLEEPQKNYTDLLRFVVAAKSYTTNAFMHPFAGWEAVGASMPKDGKVLVHHHHMHTGIGRPSVSDWPRTQTGISYGRYRSAAAMYRALKAMGITHIAWSQTSLFPDESIASELRFHEFGAKYTNRKVMGDLWFGQMPAAAPPEERDEPLIAFFGCNDRYQPGLYRFSAMAVPNTLQVKLPHPAPSEAFGPTTDVNRATARAKFVVWNAGCGFAWPAALGNGEFIPLHQRGSLSFHVRQGIP